jgi:hypothetical protein
MLTHGGSVSGLGARRREVVNTPNFVGWWTGSGVDTLENSLDPTPHRRPGFARMDRLAIGPQVGQPAPQRRVFSLLSVAAHGAAPQTQVSTRHARVFSQ